MDAVGEGSEVADALNLVIWKLNTEVIFKAREEFKRLQAVDPEFLVEIVAGLKLGTRDFEMGCRKIQDFVRGLFDCFHNWFYFTGSEG